MHAKVRPRQRMNTLEWHPGLMRVTALILSHISCRDLTGSKAGWASRERGSVDWFWSLLDTMLSGHLVQHRVSCLQVLRAEKLEIALCFVIILISSIAIYNRFCFPSCFFPLFSHLSALKGKCVSLLKHATYRSVLQKFYTHRAETLFPVLNFKLTYFTFFCCHTIGNTKFSRSLKTWQEGEL